MKKFGADGTSIDYGDLAHHVGWIEALTTDEAEMIKSWNGPKAKRLKLVEEALDKLNQALDME